ncbi:hypothetical protein JHK85_016628 [Glycine max]|nr:hypothetical protein JHK85_016628 [Glycine max]
MLLGGRRRRTKPFSLDIPPVSSSNFKPLTFLAHMKASESISCSSGRRFNLDFGNSTLREIPSLSASSSELISKKNKKGKKNIGGDFLTVIPPLTQCSCSKLKSPSGFVPFRHQFEVVNIFFPFLVVSLSGQ